MTRDTIFIVMSLVMYIGVMSVGIFASFCQYFVVPFCNFTNLNSWQAGVHWSISPEVKGQQEVEILDPIMISPAAVYFPWHRDPSCQHSIVARVSSFPFCPFYCWS